ncbi:hypothetical protein QJ854_gp254 [Moumouvirus goulette]|uniref:Uncharacterized protein n=1 Tax=Moumouvirus goulette TaxID=1247379 RepID=M1PHH2_9VIRU|nr:hypothetical protein QJ854_gp254 [Moumouvirus goulette]AGF85528.1 hypothetical protein glt_00723 [Moumouvirus goulette]
MIKKYNFEKILDICDRISLNYLIAEAIREDQSITLYYGDYIENKIIWSEEKYGLIPNFDNASKQIYCFINKYIDKIIKINIFCQKEASCLNKNIIIYVPYEIDIAKIKKEYTSIVN